MTTTLEPKANPRSRRAVLIGALGGLGAFAAHAIGRPAVADAANGDAILVGQTASGTTTTQLMYTSSQASALVVTAASQGYGVVGKTNGTGGWAGVYGQATADSQGIGVIGEASGTTAANIGVRGTSASPAGIGVEGLSSSGIGVHARSNRTALKVDGRTKFSTSGVATINAGSTRKTITPGVDVNSGSFVLLTPKANIGTRALWFTTDGPNERFTIHMNSPRSSGTKIAWLLLG